MLTYYKRKWLFCGYTICLGMLVALLTIFQGVMLQIVVDTVAGNLKIHFGYIIAMTILYGIIYFCINYLYKRNVYLAASNNIVSIKNRMIMCFLNEKNFSNKNFAEKLAVVETDIVQVFEKYQINFFALINMIILFFSASIYLLFTNVFVATVVLISGMVNIVVPQIFLPKVQGVSEKYFDSNKLFIDDIKEIINGFTTIKLFGLEEKYKDKAQKSNLLLEKNHKLQLCYQTFMEYLSSTLGFCTLVCNVVFAGYLSYKGFFSIGKVLAIMQIMNFIMQPLIQIPSIIMEMKSVKPAINNINKYMCVQNEEYTKEVTIKEVKDIVLNNTALKIDGNYILKNLNIKFEKEKKYVVVGESGSGKTSLLKLIAGYYKNYEGKIFINHETELLKIPLRQWQKFLSFIEQNIFIFNDTIIFNLCLQNDMKKDINHIIYKVGLNQFINSKEKGINDMLCEEEKISGGEKKRIAMARALCKSTGIILADEPTSGLDASNAKLIEDALTSGNEMVINVTHCLEEEVLKRYDKIVCMKDGEIVGIGNYDTLLHSNSYFQKLCDDYMYNEQRESYFG
ncbi:MAG: ABC transporter ATP-binding protein [Clostridia bacterium]|nr:ABC transporter ATP-binding protein [Clostridia bacterium]